MLKEWITWSNFCFETLQDEKLIRRIVINECKTDIVGLNKYIFLWLKYFVWVFKSIWNKQWQTARSNLRPIFSVVMPKRITFKDALTFLLNKWAGELILF